jgi:hypothetical protein
MMYEIEEVRGVQNNEVQGGGATEGKPEGKVSK